MYIYIYIYISEFFNFNFGTKLMTSHTWLDYPVKIDHQIFGYATSLILKGN